MQHYAAFHLGLHCLQKYLFRGFLSIKSTIVTCCFNEFPLYFQEQTVVGCPNSETEPDIQLSGLGIQPTHCVVDIEENEVFISPFEGAR